MANKLKTVAELRLRLTDMIEAFQDATAAGQVILTLGWSAEELDNALSGTGSDVSGAELLEGIAALSAVAEKYAEQGIAILKLRT